MPIISGGGGGSGLPLAGGTLTGALVINKSLAPNTSDKPLDVLDPLNADSEVAIGRTVDGAGNESVTATLAAALDGAAQVILTDDNLDGSVSVATSGASQFLARSTNAAASFALVAGTVGSPGFGVKRDGYPTIRSLTAAPADAALSASECALWFDSTNGAPKLMVKAKQANGTVVAAAIVLA